MVFHFLRGIVGGSLAANLGISIVVYTDTFERVAPFPERLFFGLLVGGGLGALGAWWAYAAGAGTDRGVIPANSVVVFYLFGLHAPLGLGGVWGPLQIALAIAFCIALWAGTYLLLAPRSDR